VIDSAEATAATYTYDAFGNLMVKTGSLDQPFQFSTKRYDAQTGLVYYGYRFYSPIQGRWINRDPLGESGGMNLYRFVGNSPLNYIDPNGEEPVTVLTVAFIVLGLLAVLYLGNKAYTAYTNFMEKMDKLKEDANKPGSLKAYVETNQGFADSSEAGLEFGLSYPATTAQGPPPTSLPGAIVSAGVDITIDSMCDE